MNQEGQGPAAELPALGRRRRQLLQWIIVWRLVALSCIPLVVWSHPQNMGSLPRAYLVFVGAAVYTAVHGYLFLALPSRPRALHLIDLSAGAALMLAGGVPKTVFFMTMFACSSLLAYKSPRIRDWLPGALFIGCVYFVAEDLAGLTPWDTVSSPAELGMLVLIFFFGMGLMALDIVLDRLSSLELEGLLEKQRQGYRRRLHDDLGNTLCGLHFRIEMLADLDREGARHALEYLAGGYRRAVRVLNSILGGLRETGTSDIDESLAQIKAGLERDTQVAIALSGTTIGASLSPELAREALAIVSESALNAARHAGVETVSISVARRGRCLRFVVTDSGRGFDSERLQARRTAGHRGVQGMFERASLIGADLRMDSVPGRGTRVELDVKIPLRTRFGRFLEQDPRQTSRLFSSLVFLKALVLLLVLVQIGMLPREDIFSATGVLIAGGLTLDCLLWIALRPLLFEWLTRRPWLIAINFAYFIAIFYVGQRYGYAMHFFYVVYPETAFTMSGLLLGVRKNMLLATGFALAIVASYLVAAPDPALVGRGQLIEDLITFIAAVVAIAFACGLAGDFVRKLEKEQREAITRSLARERERLTMETHRQLHDLITALGERVGSLAHAGRLQSPPDAEIATVRSLSHDLKARLRSIIVTLESPAAPGE